MGPFPLPFNQLCVVDGFQSMLAHMLWLAALSIASGVCLSVKICWTPTNLESCPLLLLLCVVIHHIGISPSVEANPFFVQDGYIYIYI
uniref:Uncharacterized protein n=1 Tax=Ixodes scapularis TaxID=6945 RepID=A0A4D5RY98_IXOSC